MNSLEIIEQRNLLTDKLEKLIEVGKVEERKLNEIENTEFNDLTKQIENLDNQLDNIEKENKVIALRSNKKINENKMTENFSLFKTIENSLTERNYEFQIPMVEYRTLSSGVVGSGSEIVPTEKMDLLTPLKYNSAFVKAGATFLTNVTSNFSYPVYAGTTASFLGENATITDGQGVVSSVDFSPKRISATITISKTLLKQSNSNLEQLLVNDIANQFAKGIDSVIGGSANVSTTQPGGLFYGVTATNLSGITYSTITGLQATLQNVDVFDTDYKFVANPSTVQTLKSIKVNEGRMVAENNKVDGIDVITGSQILNKSIVLGKWADLVIAQFGDIDVVVDPYTAAKSNGIVITATLNLDAKVLRSTSFAKLVIA